MPLLGEVGGRWPAAKKTRLGKSPKANEKDFDKVSGKHNTFAVFKLDFVFEQAVPDAWEVCKLYFVYGKLVLGVL